MARDAVALVGGDIPAQTLETARLLTGELVTNSAQHGDPSAPVVGLFVEVTRDRMRIEVTDTGATAPEVRPPSDGHGYGLNLLDALAARWHTSRQRDGNLTWFELDLPAPGA